MYQSSERHVLSPVFGNVSLEDQNVLWALFIAIGKHWSLDDDVSNYQIRYDNFLSNRIDFDPLYQGYYTKSATAIRKLCERYGESQTYRILLEEGVRQDDPVAVDQPTLDMLRKRVVGEFLTIRLAFGGFRAFGAVNYRGYFGGALSPGRPAPYRT